MEVRSMKDGSKKRMVAYIGDGRDVDGLQSVTTRLNNASREASRCLGIHVPSRSSPCARTYFSDLMGEILSIMLFPMDQDGIFHPHGLKKSSSSRCTCDNLTQYMLSALLQDPSQYGRTTAAPYRYASPDHLYMHA